MGKDSRWHIFKTMWGFIVTISVILGLIGSILQISGTFDFWNSLFLPIYNFIMSSIPLYSFIIIVVILIIAIFVISKIRGRKKMPILDFSDARNIAILCQTPRTTEFLRKQYDYWESQSSAVFIGGYGFNDYMKFLEKEGYLEYINGKWHVTQSAIDYIKKYHGG
jgi:hypothetical protein